MTSLCFHKFSVRCVGSVILEIPNWQATENKNLNSLGEGRAGEFCGYGNHESKRVNQEDRRVQAVAEPLGTPTFSES